MNKIPFIISVAFSTFGYIACLAITSSEKIRVKLSPDINNNAKHIFFQRLTGVFIFGILPASGIIYFTDFKFIFLSFTKESLLWAFLVSCFIIPLNYFNSKKSGNLAVYPQIRQAAWPAGLLIASAVSWIAYLFAYEMLFRGFLLFSSLEIMGYWPAILLNTGIYSLVHYPKGLKETIGAVPFGIILCILSVKTGSFLTAFLVHSVLALSNEWFSLYAKSHSYTLKQQ
jgi:membrane protease YdiL (CAAX protease family)